VKFHKKRTFNNSYFFGFKIRNVTCIQEVRHGGNNILTVLDGLCPQPPPITQQFCNVVDCPAQWTTTTWTKVRF
jgi:hypothetical protein